jgi:hypothetical protein
LLCRQRGNQFLVNLARANLDPVGGGSSIVAVLALIYAIQPLSQAMTVLPWVDFVRVVMTLSLVTVCLTTLPAASNSVTVACVALKHPGRPIAIASAAIKIKNSLRI